MEKINEYFRFRTAEEPKRKNEESQFFICASLGSKRSSSGIKSIAMRMRKEGSKDTEPSQKQLEFAQFLCDKKGLKIQNDVLSSSKKLSEWLNKNKKKEDKTKK